MCIENKGNLMFANIISDNILMFGNILCDVKGLVSEPQFGRNSYRFCHNRNMYSSRFCKSFTLYSSRFYH